MGVYPTGVQYRGINRSGAENPDEWDGWKSKTDSNWYDIPDMAKGTQELGFYANRGFNALRLPVSWERLQHTLLGDLDAGYAVQVWDFVNQATTAGWLVIIDLHNYNRYATDAFDAAGDTPAGVFTVRTYGDADGVLTRDALVDVWTRIAGMFPGNSNVAFGLMNEPHDFPVTSDVWFDDLQHVIDAIRVTGADQLILVPNSRGSDVTHWSTWSPNGGPPDSVAAQVIKDGNYAFDLHAYHDHFDPADPTHTLPNPHTYAEELTEVTDWAKANGRRLFLSEFGVDKNYPAEGPGAVDSLLGYLNANQDVWLGWTAWDDADPAPDHPYTLTLLDLVTWDRIDGPEMGWYTAGQKYLTPNTV